MTDGRWETRSWMAVRMASVDGVCDIKERILGRSVMSVRSPNEVCLERQAEKDSGWIMRCASSGDVATSPTRRRMS